MQHRTLIRTVLVGGFLLLPHLSSAQSFRILTEDISLFCKYMSPETQPTDAKIPDVYFLIGDLNSGGTTSDTGLLIGAEMYGRTGSTDTTELSA